MDLANVLVDVSDDDRRCIQQVFPGGAAAGVRVQEAKMGSLNR